MAIRCIQQLYDPLALEFINGKLPLTSDSGYMFVVYTVIAMVYDEVILGR